MENNKNWIVGLVVFVIIIGLGVWGFAKYNQKKVAGVETNTISEEIGNKKITGNESYFDPNAKVMEFYQPNCSWCVKQSDVLEELAKDGYRVKPMDAAVDASLWQKYNVNGTPTFIAENGDRLEGYQNKEALKAFLDAHK